MATSSSVLPGPEDATAVVRFNPAPGAATKTFILPALPELESLPLPLGLTPASINVPGYEILRELGRGGMGVVYLARQRKLDRLVALKMVLARQYAGPEDQLRFRQEVEAVAKLNHPNIAQVYEVGEHDGFAFAAFEYVDGGTLLAWQKDKIIPPQDAARLIVILARAVQHAHDHGIIHRDLKPANILLQGFGVLGLEADSSPKFTTRLSGLNLTNIVTGGSASHTPNPKPQTPIPKITDFGLAKKLDGASNLTATGMACGTPNYMAPEQIRGKSGQVGPAADVYGLGAILFELLISKPPFRCDTPLETMQAALTEPAPGVQKLRPEVPQDLDVIVAKCLEKDPARRYPSAAALADDLERFLENRPILARGVGPVERSRRWIARNPLATILIVTFMVGFAATLAASLFLWRTVERERITAHEREVAFVQMRLARDEATTQKGIAETAKAAAESRQKEAEAARKQADASLQDAKTSAARASESLNLATATVDTLLSRFATDPRFQDADFLTLRQDLLRDATYLYGKLQNQDRDQTQLEHHSLRAQYFLGLLSRVAGKVESGNDHIADAMERYTRLLDKHPGHSDWQIEFANMHLDEIDRAQQDGVARYSTLIRHLNIANVTLDAVLAGEKDRAALEAARFKAKVAKVYLIGLKSPEEQSRWADDAFVMAETMLRSQPRDPNVVDLYGKVLVYKAQAAARAGSADAECYFEAAEEHYNQAYNVWFPTGSQLRWRCRGALACKAHGEYYDALGLYDLSDAAYTKTRSILETTLDYAPEVAPYRLDLAEAYLHIIKRMRKLRPDKDPLQMVDMLDVRLAPFWNAGAPTDRARRVLSESKVIAAEWCAANGRLVDAGNFYTLAANFALHSVKENQGREFRDFAADCWSHAAVQYAIARQPSFAMQRLTILQNLPALSGTAWYNIARTWAVLATGNPDAPDTDLQRAVEALHQADAENHFRDAANLKLFQSHGEFAKIRDKFAPKNIP